ncbi:MAG: hypothetical protein R3D58_17315 [Saprospiraceae bacterium]
MKNAIKTGAKQGANSPLPVDCQVLLSCLTGIGGRLPLPDFYQIWGQMLPESNPAIPVSDIPGRQAASRPPAGAAISNTSQTAKIREGPD